MVTIKIPVMLQAYNATGKQAYFCFLRELNRNDTQKKICQVMILADFLLPDIDGQASYNVPLSD
jgi:hypothetical protein